MVGKKRLGLLDVILLALLATPDQQYGVGLPNTNGLPYQPPLLAFTLHVPETFQRGQHLADALCGFALELRGEAVGGLRPGNQQRA